MKLLHLMKKNKPLHMTLIDPGSVTPDKGSTIGEKAALAGTDVFLLGGSTHIDPVILDTSARKLKALNKPVVLFPGNINGITREADGILYLVLMNSLDPYYITGVHVQAAPLILKTGLEVIPTSYVIVGYGGTVGHIGRALPVPNEKPELIASYALAGAYMGAKAVYLEAGSGSPFIVNPEGVRMARKLIDEAGTDTLIIVGGGVRSPRDAEELVAAGADAIVTGNIAEENPEVLVSIIETIKSYR